MRDKCFEYISQIIDNLERIEENRKHIASEEEFYSETAYSDSCYFRLALIGELCAKPELEQLRERHSEIPWKNLYGLRNKIDHAYADVTFDQKIVWETIVDDVPKLKEKFESIKNEMIEVNEESVIEASNNTLIDKLNEKGIDGLKSFGGIINDAPQSKGRKGEPRKIK